VSRYPVWSAGQRITAAMLTAGQPNSVTKQANEQLTSSVTLQNDNELALAVEANSVYDVTLVLFGQTANSDIAGDLAVGFTFPSGGVLHWTGTGPNNADLSVANSSSAKGEWIARMSATSGVTTIPYGMSGVAIGVILHATLITSSAGTLQLQWAQNASDADALTILAGSRMKALRTA
jgi:hypothetical protein